ncbi:hypothetical protein G7046_g6182 [Stylonectria norvegica]|nr:hypothetical protein G7046_g6182 [Stylonectria norvegica]
MTTCATTTIELQPVKLQSLSPPAKLSHKRSFPAQPRVLERTSQSSSSRVLAEAGGAEPNATPEVEVTQKWNEPSINKYRMGAAFWSLLVMGANDAAYGLEAYYDLTYTVVSMVFISPFVGYVASAILNNYLHLKIGQRGIGMLCGACHTTAYVVIALHPPYASLIIAFIFAGFGNGLGDAAWNAWMGNLANASELLGFMHACYGVGGVFSPLVSTSMITKGGLPWYTFYYIMIGFSVIEFAVLTWAFWDADGTAYRSVYRDNEIERETGLSNAIFHRPTARTAWVCAFFLLCYVGVEVALGGWIVVFMTQVRGGEPFASGMTATGFWLGITVGRAVLGFVTPRLGVKVAISGYIMATMALELLFWLVPQFYVSAVAVAFQGFFLGPLFPGVVLVASKLLPRHQHVIVIGFAAALGGCGAAILPFAPWNPTDSSDRLAIAVGRVVRGDWKRGQTSKESSRPHEPMNPDLAPLLTLPCLTNTSAAHKARHGSRQQGLRRAIGSPWMQTNHNRLFPANKPREGKAFVQCMYHVICMYEARPPRGEERRGEKPAAGCYSSIAPQPSSIAAPHLSPGSPGNPDPLGPSRAAAPLVSGGSPGSTGRSAAAQDWRCTVDSLTGITTLAPRSNINSAPERLRKSRR